jgi:hypothetical protein
MLINLQTMVDEVRWGHTPGGKHFTWKDVDSKLYALLALEALIPPRHSRSAAHITIAWNPEEVSSDDYAALVASLRRLVILHGGSGLRRLEGSSVAVDAPVGSRR